MFASAGKTLRSLPTPDAIPDTPERHRSPRGHAARRVRNVTASIGRMSLIAFLTSFATQGYASAIISSLQPNLVDYYTFDNPVTGNAAHEADQGF